MQERTIPPLVRAQLDIHRVETQMRLETVKRQLEGGPVTAVQSRRLRAQRDLLVADMLAWEYLIRVVDDSDAPVPQAPAITPATCADCGHAHVQGTECLDGQTAVGYCGCTA